MSDYQVDRIYTVEEYLALELSDPQRKYEYIDGQISSMAGGSIRHGLLISNAQYWIRNSLRNKNKSCKTFGGEVKVSISEANAYLYPDVFVVCGEIDDSDNPNQAVKNPILIIEILSKSTQQFDQSQKFRLYRSNPSFEEYVMVNQDEPIVESYYRLGEDHWQINTMIGLEKEIEFRSIGIKMKMSDLYEDILS